MAMNFTSLIISVILVGMFTIGITSFITDLASNYGVPYDDNTATFKVLNNMTALTDETSQTVFDDTTTLGTTAEALASQGASTMKLSLTSVELIQAMFQDLSEKVGMPSWFLQGIIAIITVVLVFLTITVLIRGYQQL